MNVRTLIDLLVKEDPGTSLEVVLSKPSFEAVATIATSLRRRHARTRAKKEAFLITEADRVEAEKTAKWCDAWNQDPKAFFGSWSMEKPEKALCIGEAHELPAFVEETQVLTKQETTKQDLCWKLEQLRKVSAPTIEDCAQQVMYKIFFYDVVLSGSARRNKRGSDPAGLPRRGLRGLISKAWQKLTGEDLNKETEEDLTKYVKDGQRYCELGREVGEGVWLLLPRRVVDTRWHGNAISKETYRTLKLALEQMPGSERAGEAARKIRTTQSLHYKSDPQKRQLDTQDDKNQPCKRLKDLTGGKPQNLAHARALVDSHADRDHNLPEFVELLHENSCARWTEAQTSLPDTVTRGNNLLTATSIAPALPRSAAPLHPTQALQKRVFQNKSTAQVRDIRQGDSNQSSISEGSTKIFAHHGLRATQQTSARSFLDDSTTETGIEYYSPATHAKNMVTLSHERNSITHQPSSSNGASCLDNSCPAADFSHFGELAPLQIDDFSHFGGVSAEVMVPDNFSGFGEESGLIFSSSDWTSPAWLSIEASQRSIVLH